MPRIVSISRRLFEKIWSSPISICATAKATLVQLCAVTSPSPASSGGRLHKVKQITIVHGLSKIGHFN